MMRPYIVYYDEVGDMIDSDKIIRMSVRTPGIVALHLDNGEVLKSDVSIAELYTRIKEANGILSTSIQEGAFSNVGQYGRVCP